MEMYTKEVHECVYSELKTWLSQKLKRKKNFLSFKAWSQKLKAWNLI